MTESNQKFAFLRNHEATNQCELNFFVNILISGQENIEEIKAVRQKSDNVESLIQHIKNKIQKIIQDKLKENGDEKAPQEVAVTLRRNSSNKSVKGIIVLQDLLNQTKHTFNLQVFDQKFAVIINAPLVKEVRLPAVFYANFSVQPTKFFTLFTKFNACEFFWYKSLDKSNWTKVGDKYHYTIEEEDIDHYLKFVCIPYNETKLRGPAYEVISESVVEKIAEMPTCPFEERHKLTQERLNGSKFRAVSYNILSEKYTTDSQFSYCPPRSLATDYRKQLILKELLGYNADIICLQEVDFRHYKNYFRKKFEEHGYGSVYHKKGERLTEGLACIYDNRKFKEISRRQIVLSNEIRKQPFAYLWNIIKNNKEVRDCFLRQATSLQITVLQPNKSNYNIVVANTHLYYHPEAEHIRLLQINMIATFLSRFTSYLSKSGNKVSLVLCGDFNSRPESSIYKFVVEGKIHPQHAECLKLSENGNALLYHNLNFESACGTPNYTNYTDDFKGCLDYIFVDFKKTRVLRPIPLIDDKELEIYKGLPNDVFPSDHLALVVDLEYI